MDPRDYVPVAPSMSATVGRKVEVEIEATITRADGTVERLGVVARTDGEAG